MPPTARRWRPSSTGRSPGNKFRGAVGAAVRTVSEFTVLAASPAEVFAFLDEPSNQAAVTPGIADAERIERLDDGGNRAEYTYRMAGLSFDGEVVATAYEPDERIVYDVRGSVAGTIEWTFEPAGEGTRFTYAADYDLPSAALDALAAPVLERYNRRQVRATLGNLREEFGAGGG